MQTKLKTFDRWVSLIGGLGVAIYSLFGGYDDIIVRGAMAVFVGVMATGGICGT